MPEVQDKLIPVEAHFTGACSGVAMFTLIPFNDGNVHMGVRFDDLFSGKHVPVSFPHNLREGITFDETDAADFMRETLKELEAVRHEYDMLNTELHSTSNTARYEELKAPYGPVRTLERKRDALKTVFSLTFYHVMGVWPGNLRDMGIV